MDVTKNHGTPSFRQNPNQPQGSARRTPLTPPTPVTALAFSFGTWQLGSLVPQFMNNMPVDVATMLTQSSVLGMHSRTPKRKLDNPKTPEPKKTRSDKSQPDTPGLNKQSTPKRKLDNPKTPEPKKTRLNESQTIGIDRSEDIRKFFDLLLNGGHAVKNYWTRLEACHENVDKNDVTHRGEIKSMMVKVYSNHDTFSDREMASMKFRLIDELRYHLGVSTFNRVVQSYGRCPPPQDSFYFIHLNLEALEGLPPEKLKMRCDEKRIQRRIETANQVGEIIRQACREIEEAMVEEVDNPKKRAFLIMYRIRASFEATLELDDEFKNEIMNAPDLKYNKKTGKIDAEQRYICFIMFINRNPEFRDALMQIFNGNSKKNQEKFDEYLDYCGGRPDSLYGALDVAFNYVNVEREKYTNPINSLACVGNFLLKHTNFITSALTYKDYQKGINHTELADSATLRIVLKKEEVRKKGIYEQFTDRFKQSRQLTKDDVVKDTNSFGKFVLDLKKMLGEETFNKLVISANGELTIDKDERYYSLNLDIGELQALAKKNWMPMLSDNDLRMYNDMYKDMVGKNPAKDRVILHMIMMYEIYVQFKMASSPGLKVALVSGTNPSSDKRAFIQYIKDNPQHLAKVRIMLAGSKALKNCLDYVDGKLKHAGKRESHGKWYSVLRNIVEWCHSAQDNKLNVFSSLARVSGFIESYGTHKRSYVKTAEKNDDAKHKSVSSNSNPKISGQLEERSDDSDSVIIENLQKAGESSLSDSREEESQSEGDESSDQGSASDDQVGQGASGNPSVSLQPMRKEHAPAAPFLTPVKIYGNLEEFDEPTNSGTPARVADEYKEKINLLTPTNPDRQLRPKDSRNRSLYVPLNFDADISGLD